MVLSIFSSILPLSSTIAMPDAGVKYAIIRAENPRGEENSLILPYGFPSDSMGFTLGVGGMLKGYGQEQLLLAGSVLGSSDDAAIAILGMWDYQLPMVDRLFFSAFGSTGHYPKQRAYVSAPRPVGMPYAGGNDSDQDDYFEDSGTDNWADFKLEYVLPLGAGRNSPMQTYKIKSGVLQSGASGGDSWNPLNSGVTVLMLKQFNRYQSFDLPIGKKDYSTHPLRVALYYNNTDFPTNPSSGSSQYIAYTRDFSWGEYEEKWDFIEFEASKYIGLGTNDYTKHQAIALNFWTGHSPSFNYSVDDDGNREAHDAPPFSQGATLGGLYRMRAYPENRFNDRSAIYASAEYRWTPVWNPLGQISWLKFLQTDWMQFVPFIEVGRVADDYDLGELFSDMKVDGGLSFRAMMAGGVARFDMAFSDEGGAAWVMFGHPF